MQNEITITNSQDFRDAILDVIRRTDFIAIGQMKPHMKENEQTGEKTETGEYFMSTQIRMPNSVPITVDGVELFPNSLQFKVDAFKLSADPRRTAPESKPQAASANAKILREKLLAGRKPVPAATHPAPAHKA